MYYLRRAGKNFHFFLFFHPQTFSKKSTSYRINSHLISTTPAHINSGRMQINHRVANAYSPRSTPQKSLYSSGEVEFIFANSINQLTPFVVDKFLLGILVRVRKISQTNQNSPTPYYPILRETSEMAKLQ